MTYDEIAVEIGKIADEELNLLAKKTGLKGRKCVCGHNWNVHWMYRGPDCHGCENSNRCHCDGYREE